MLDSADRKDMRFTEDTLKQFLGRYRHAKSAYQSEPSPENLRELIDAANKLEIEGQFAETDLKNISDELEKKCHERIDTLASEIKALEERIKDAVMMIAEPGKREDYRSRAGEYIQQISCLLDELEKDI